MQNWKKIWAIKKQQTDRFKKWCPNMENNSGIYTWYRLGENGNTYFYSGQSKHLVDRSVSHITAYDHLGLSIKKRGLYSNENPNGWKIKWYYCTETELNDNEKNEIAENISIGWVSYNITGGSQGVGKVDIGERKPTKTYRQGVEYGEQKALKEIKVYFEKYLDFKIKGNTNKIKQKKYEEFERLLKNNG